jgi:Icc-related predicted phosphoesterase
VLRILAVADHSDEWPDDNDLARLCRAADLILTLGDLTKQDVSRLVVHGTPVAGVYGNHCVRGYLKELRATDLSNGGIAAVGDTPFGSILGISGCVRYKKGSTNLLWTQDEYHAALTGLPRADWVVTHCPPRGCNDHDDPAHVGIEALTDYVKQHRPRHLFHGHTYPDDPITQFAHTDVHYGDGWAAIRLDMD